MLDDVFTGYRPQLDVLNKHHSNLIKKRNYSPIGF